jgi:hypothetical protein
MLARLVAYVRGIARRRMITVEVEDELLFHLEQEVEAHVARGVAPAEARRMALRDLGGVTQTREAVRDVRTIWLDLFRDMWSDLRLAWRSLQRSPIFAATAILTLAIGIGGSTAIFSIVNAVLLRPLPYHDPDRLVRIWESHPAEGNGQSPVSAANFNDWRTRSRTFDGLALFTVVTEPIVLGVGDASLQARQTVITPNLFSLLRVHPVVGREFGVAPERRRPFDGSEVVVSHSLCQRAFGGDPAAIGRTVRVEGAPGSVVVGVMPNGFSFPEGADFWTPMDATRAAAGRREVRMNGAIGRLAANVSVAAARLDLQSVAGVLAREYPASNAQWTVAILSLHDSVVDGYCLALITLFAAVAFVMLVGCANVSNLLLARGVARRGELAVRTFVRLKAVDLGFDPEHVISIEARVPIYRTLAPDRWQLLASDTSAALQRLRSVPGVQAVSATRDLPLAGNLLTTEITLPGEPRPRHALYHRVSPQYFRTMEMTLVQGRDFTDEDVSDLARLPDPRMAVPRQGAVIVNETTARTFWPSGNAIGQYLSTSFDARPINRRQVVGIVRDARSETLRGGPPAEVYVPYLEDPSFAMTLLVRTTLPTDQIVPILRRELRNVSADMSTANIRMLDEIVGDSIPDITRMFLKQAAGPICVGVILGTASALALGRLVQALLFGVAPTDAVSYAAAASMLVGVALAASYLPVRRVLQTDPARALRG